MTGIFESLNASLALFFLSAAVITVVGIRLTDLADRLADKTGWGEALLGGLFLAGVTSLPDFAATMTAAADGYAELAMGNILGSLAVNFVFLAIADLSYRKANLEHAAASTSNLVQAGLLIALLTIPMLAKLSGEIVLWGVHPATPVLFIAYVFGYRMIQRDHATPMWAPRHTAQTVKDTPDTQNARSDSLAGLWTRFALLAALAGLAGWALMNCAETIVDETALSASIVGTLFTAVFTSLPELVTTIAAVRYGALTLAVGNIIGTNCFNVLVIAASDVVYREGSLYHAVTPQQMSWVMVTILLTSILLLGMLRRERYGIARIGFESFLILLVYAGAAASLLLFG